MSLKKTNAIASRISVEHLAEALSYNPATGEFVWKERPAKHFHDAGKPADVRRKLWNGKFADKPALTCQDPRGYRKGMLNQKMIWAHRAAVAISTGMWPEGEVDHINRDKTDNRLCNLRVVTHRENRLNCPDCDPRGVAR